MFRLVFMAFLGESRVAADKKSHLHESPPSISIPLIVLGALSLIAGFMGVPHILSNFLGHVPNLFENYLAPVFSLAPISHRVHGETVELALLGVNLAVAFGGAFLAFLFYRRGSTLPARLAGRTQRVFQLLQNKYYVDELTDRFIVNPLYRFSEAGLFKLVDRMLIDFMVNAVAKIAGALAFVGQKFQTGQTQTYVFFMWAGVLFLIYLLR
jgi:NADH-quinone oxidoreductase subunit L